MPPELTVGPLIEVWAVDPPSQGGRWPVRPVSVRRRWSDARDAWCERLPATERAQVRSRQSGPWSVEWLDRNGRADEATERLAAAGVERRELPALRRTAGQWLDRLGASRRATRALAQPDQEAVGSSHSLIR